MLINREIEYISSLLTQLPGPQAYSFLPSWFFSKTSPDKKDWEMSGTVRRLICDQMNSFHPDLTQMVEWALTSNYLPTPSLDCCSFSSRCCIYRNKIAPVLITILMSAHTRPVFFGYKYSFYVYPYGFSPVHGGYKFSPVYL